MNLLNANQIIPGGCTDTESEQICMKQASEDNENAFLFTLDLKKNVISAHIRNITINTKEEIISDIKSTGCTGEIASWSDQSGDILFLDRFNGTPQSPSGEMLSTVCVYNYKSQSLIYKKNLPVDIYQNSVSDMKNGMVFLYSYLPQHILINYRINQEDILPIKEDQTIMQDHIDLTFKNGLILLQSPQPNGFYIEGYDIDQKEVRVSAFLSRETPANKLETPQTDSIRFINMSDDQKNLMFEYQPSNDLNTPNSSSCKLNVKIASGTVNKVACGYEFQAKYPYKTPPAFDEYVYADFIDWD